VNDSLIDRIRQAAERERGPLPFPVATVGVVEETERLLGFAIPALLRSCLLGVGNGGYGPGYGLIGVAGGYASDSGTLVEVRSGLRDACESEGLEWPKGLLPFCEWGSNIFSCVDGLDPRHPIHTFEMGSLGDEGYDLESFFERWIRGEPVSHDAACESVPRRIINPFTSREETIWGRRPRRPG
jgi:hypothetical protein